MPRDDVYKPEQSNVALWPNERKQRDSDPDLTGTAQIVDEATGEVTEYWASAWENEPGGKRPVINIKLKRKDAAPTARQHVASRRHDPQSAGKRYAARPRQQSNMETWEKKHGGKPQPPPDNDFHDDDVPF